MFRSFLILAFVTLQLVPRAVPLPTPDQFFEVFRSYLESLRSQSRIPALSAAVIGPTGILWEGAFGQQDIERFVSTRTDTLFHLDDLTEVFTASLVLRCVEEGHLSLDDRIGQFDPGSPDANATVGQLLTHTDGVPGNATYSYRPARLVSLSAAISSCRAVSYRGALAAVLDRLALQDSVPGSDATAVLDPDVPGSNLARYGNALTRLAVPYAVDRFGRPSRSRYSATTMTPVSGLISTVRDYAKFDLALKQGVLLRPETLAAAWRAPLNSDGHPLPHGIGWFVQTYKGEKIAWQFGVSDDASSSLVMMIPARGVTVIIAANSDGLVKPFALSAGDLTISPFGQLFLGAFVR